MERKTITKRLKGVMAMMLAFLMLAGNPIIAQAVTVIDYGLEGLHEGLILNEGDLIYSHGTGGILDVYIDNQKISPYDSTYFYPEPDYDNYEYFHVPAGKQLLLKRIVEDPDFPNLRDYSTYYFVTYNGPESPEPSVTHTNSHSHNYEWVTTLEPTTTADGLSEYLCECGSVTASQPVSYLSFLVKQILSDIKNAPENGTVTINYEGLRCLNQKMTEALLSRPDVTLIVQFTDKGESHQFTIPAGQAPTDGADWYGYYYLGALYGWQ